MKRVFVFFLTFILIMPTLCYAATGMIEKLENHWAKDEMQREFLLYYFPYLAKGNFERFDPNEVFYEDEFLLSFSSLLKDNGYPWSTIGWRKRLTRIDMVDILCKRLLDIGVVETTDAELPFIDINEISEEKKQALINLYSAGIINGQSESKFNPSAYTTQAEAILVLQRIDYLLKQIANNKENDQEAEDQLETRKVPFKLSGALQSFSGEEGIITKSKNDKLYVTITKAFPNPGYSMEIDGIIEDEADYRISLKIMPPSKESIQLQVITFKTITIEIEKKDLRKAPYSFIFEK